MDSNSIVEKGCQVAEFYYHAQRYFAQFILLTEGVATLLQDQGWEITVWNYGRPVVVQSASWTDQRGAHLPKFYKLTFAKKMLPGAKVTDQYGFCIWFSQNDPSGEQSWVPTGFFYRAILKEGGKWEEWRVIPKIAETVRNYLLRPQADETFLEFKSPWPDPLAGDGVENQLQSVSVVPFPLVSIATSEDLDYITTKAIKALSELNPDIITKNTQYLSRVWSL